jgi:DNA polymerase-3 subunit beta
MNAFRTTRESLLAALAAIKPAVDTNKSIPVLTCVKFVAGADGCSAHATNLDVHANAAFDANADGEFTVIVPFAGLEKMVRSALPKTAIRIEQAIKCRQGIGESRRSDGETNDLFETFVNIGPMRTRLLAINPSDWPDAPAKAMPHEFTLPTRDVLSALRKTAMAISTEETRYYLNGTYLHVVTIDGRDTLRFIATDGHRMARVEMPAPAGSTGMPGVIIPRLTVAHLIKLCAAKGSADNVSIKLGVNTVEFSIGAVTVNSKLIDGTFPDYGRVIPAGNDKRLTVERDELASAVKQVSTMSSDRGRCVKLEISQTGIRLSVDNPDAGAASLTVSNIDYDRAPLDIGFNATYLLNILAQIESDTVLFRLSDSGSPTIIQDRDGASALYVLMPMRVSSGRVRLEPAAPAAKPSVSRVSPAKRRAAVMAYLTKRADRADRAERLRAERLARIYAYLASRKARATSAPASGLTPVPTDAPIADVSIADVPETAIQGETGEWLDFLASKIGTRKWIVAGRLSAKMRAKGYEKAVSSLKFEALKAKWSEIVMMQDANSERATMAGNNAAARLRRINAYLERRSMRIAAPATVPVIEDMMMNVTATPLPPDGAAAPLAIIDALDCEIVEREPSDPRIGALAEMFARRSEIERYRAVRAFVGIGYGVPPGIPFRDPLALAAWVIERLPVALAA